MTTPADWWVTTIPTIKDRDSLHLVSRLVESQLTVLEAQVNQLRQVHEAVQERLKG